MKYNLPTQIDQAVDKLKSLSGLVEITKKRKLSQRSISQNKLYWLWLTCIEQETGNDRNDLHELFKIRYIDKNKLKLGGYSAYIPVSTTQLDSAKFTYYLDKIQIFSSTELGISLPNPTDQNFEQFVEHYQKYL